MVIVFTSKEAHSPVLKTRVHQDDKTTCQTSVSKLKVNENIDLAGSDGSIIFVNESGLFSLAFGGNKAFARLFKCWVAKGHPTNSQNKCLTTLPTNIITSVTILNSEQTKKRGVNK